MPNTTVLVGGVSSLCLLVDICTVGCRLDHALSECLHAGFVLGRIHSADSWLDRKFLGMLARVMQSTSAGF